MREHTVNRVFLYGRISADPEVGVLKNGAMFANLVLRTFEPRRARDNKMGEKPQYHALRAYGRAASVVVDCCVQKGSLVTVEGRLDHEAWRTNGGEHVNRTAIICSYINLLDATVEDDHQSGPEPAPLTPRSYAAEEEGS
jgi:single-strand DNA-binding protein